MKILFHLAHPAQYHMFKYVIEKLSKNGHKIKITINTKDILENLLSSDGVKYENILPKRRKNNTKISALFTLLKKDLALLRTQIKGNYDILIGTESALSHIGWLLRKPVIIMDEDDISVIPEAAKVSFPFATHIVAPDTCDLGKWTRKKISYSGFQKLAYLHPKYFKPQESLVYNVLGKKEKYFLLRISALSAYHDYGVKGFTFDTIRKLLQLLTPYGKVLISTEKQLPEEFLPYVYEIKITDIHHYINFADLLIADSQSMCVEAAIIGTPSIRFSDFAGKIGVLEELEHFYDLTYGFKTNDEPGLLRKVNMLLNTQNIKPLWHSKRDKMLKDKIDVTAFWTWIIENYPSSVEKLKKYPDFQRNFIN